jgi:hypothetical protein
MAWHTSIAQDQASPVPCPGARLLTSPPGRAPVSSAYTCARTNSGAWQPETKAARRPDSPPPWPRHPSARNDRSSRSVDTPPWARKPAPVPHHRALEAPKDTFVEGRATTPHSTTASAHGVSQERRSVTTVTLCSYAPTGPWSASPVCLVARCRCRSGSPRLDMPHERLGSTGKASKI